MFNDNRITALEGEVEMLKARFSDMKFDVRNINNNLHITTDSLVFYPEKPSPVLQELQDKIKALEELLKVKYENKNLSHYIPKDE